MMRFADALSGGLLGAITGKDMSQGVIPGLLGKDMSGGIAGVLIGDSYPSLSKFQEIGTAPLGVSPDLENFFNKQKSFMQTGIMGGPTPFN
jgi:hypothetical protein